MTMPAALARCAFGGVAERLHGLLMHSSLMSQSKERASGEICSLGCGVRVAADVHIWPVRSLLPAVLRSCGEGVPNGYQSKTCMRAGASSIHLHRYTLAHDYKPRHMLCAFVFVNLPLGLVLQWVGKRVADSSGIVWVLPASVQVGICFRGLRASRPDAPTDVHTDNGISLGDGHAMCIMFCASCGVPSRLVVFPEPTPGQPPPSSCGFTIRGGCNLIAW